MVLPAGREIGCRRRHAGAEDRAGNVRERGFGGRKSRETLLARALSQTGRTIHHATVSRWAAQGWRPVAYRPHPVEAARQALDLAAGVLTGDPAAGTKILGEHPEREQLGGLSDSEVLRRSARELCISTILACEEFQELRTSRGRNPIRRVPSR